MRIITVAGTVGADAEIVENPGKKPFISVTVESWRDSAQYPERTKCMIYESATYPQKLREAVRPLAKGAPIWVLGDLSVEAFIGKRDPGKPIASAKCFVRSYKVLGLPGGGSSAPPPSQSHRPAPSQPDLPATGAPVSGVTEDDIPF